MEAEKTNGIGKKEKAAILTLDRFSKTGFEKVMKKYKLDAVVMPDWDFSRVLANGGYPGVAVLAGYGKDGPFGISFGGLKRLRAQVD